MSIKHSKLMKLCKLSDELPPSLRRASNTEASGQYPLRHYLARLLSFSVSWADQGAILGSVDLLDLSQLSFLLFRHEAVL